MNDKISIGDMFCLGKKLYDKCLQPVCDTFGITRNELDIILFLANQPEYDTAADIVSRRKLTKSHVSVSLKSLIRQEYVQTFYREGNRKSIHLQLTGRADGIIEQGRSAQRQFFTTVFQGLSDGQMDTMKESMEMITDNVRKAMKGDLLK